MKKSVKVVKEESNCGAYKDDYLLNIKKTITFKDDGVTTDTTETEFNLNPIVDKSIVIDWCHIKAVCGYDQLSDEARKQYDILTKFLPEKLPSNSDGLRECADETSNITVKKCLNYLADRTQAGLYDSQNETDKLNYRIIDAEIRTLLFSGDYKLVEFGKKMDSALYSAIDDSLVNQF